MENSVRSESRNKTECEFLQFSACVKYKKKLPKLKAHLFTLYSINSCIHMFTLNALTHFMHLP